MLPALFRLAPSLRHAMERNEPLAFVEIGPGVLPIQNIIDAAAHLPNLDYLILEQDYNLLPETESIQISRQAFKDGFTGISWD